MLDPLITAQRVAASGLEAQSMRLRVVAENLANAESTGRTPGADPYRRKSILFSSEMDRLSGATLTRVAGTHADFSPLRLEYRPGHPAADADGNVKLPNVNVIVELADMKEANRSYEANLQVLKQGRDMLQMTIDLLRSGS